MFPLLDLDKVLAVHGAALEYTVRIQTAADRKAKQNTNSVAKAAILSLMHDMACFHQAIGDVCRSGWAFASPILLRSMLESTMSIAVIVANDHPDLTGFKYLYAKVSEDGHDPNMAASVAEEERRNIEVHLSEMSAEDRDAAKRFLEERPVRRF